MAKERKRSLSMVMIPPLFFSGTFQIVLSASLRFPNTPAAPKSSVTAPMMIASVPLFGFAAFASISAIAFAPASPISVRSCATICACA